MEKIEKENVLAVEGKDEKNFFEALLKTMSITNVQMSKMRWLNMTQNITNNINMYTVFRGIFVGVKSIILLYIYIIITSIFSSSSFFIPLFIFGLLNGFIDGVIISIKNITKYKILSSIIGFIVTIFVFLLSLYINLPNILVDYFVYGKGGGGLEPSGWFGFTFVLLSYFGISLFISFPMTMVLFSKNGNAAVTDAF